MCSAQVVSKNKKMSMFICKNLEDMGFDTYVCANEKEIKEALKNVDCIKLFVLVLENANGEEVEEFSKFNENFLHYISKDNKIIISDKQQEGCQTFYQFKKFIEENAKDLKEKIAHCIAKEDKYINTLNKKVANYLINSGFNTKYCGFNYIKDTICYYLLNKQIVKNLSSTAYIFLQEKYNKNLNSLERNIRIALLANKAFYDKLFSVSFSAKGFLKYLVMDVRNDNGIRCYLEKAALV